MRRLKSIGIILAIVLCFCSVVGCTDDGAGDSKPQDGVQINVVVGEHAFSATLADNDTAKAFLKLLPLTLNMSELNGNEKYNNLSGNLPSDAVKPGTIHAGDLMLYGSNCVVLFYKTFSSSYSYTRIGWVNDTNGLASALGGGKVTVKFETASTGDDPEQPEQPEQPGQSEQPEQPEQPENPDPPENPDQDEEITTMYITINGNKKEVTLEDNSSVKALAELLKKGDITYTASDYGGFEKVGDLGHTLPSSDTQMTTEPGDVILYSSSSIVLFYGSNSWSYTRIGKIKYSTLDELKSFLGAGQGSVQVTLGLN